jgi:hypothetical protein
MTDAKHLVERIATEAEASMNTPMPADTKYTHPNRGKSVALSLRLNPSELDAVHRLATERDVPVSALVRGWIVQQLAAEHATPTEAAEVVERLEADVRTLRKLVAS